MTPLPLRFTGTVVSGLGKGSGVVRVPTLNIELKDVPPALDHGIYAGRALIEGSWLPAAIHYGPRPVFKASEAFEVHVLDREVEAPESLAIEVVQYLRDIQDFPTPDALREAILSDIERTREITG